MCRPKPYPRCSDHARKNLAKVKSNKNATPEQLALAIHDWQISPDGIKEAREAGNDFQADLRTAERNDLNTAAKRHFARVNKKKVQSPKSVLADNTGDLPLKDNVLRDPSELGDDYDRLSLAENKETSAEDLEVLSRDEAYPSILLAVSKNPNTPESVLTKMARREYFDVDGEELSLTSALAYNENISSEALEALAAKSSMSDYDMAAIGYNPKTPIHILREYAESDFSEVREAVAENPSTPRELLVALSDDYYASIRAAVASNDNTDEALLEKFVADEDSDVRSGAAMSNAATPAMLLTLSEDIDKKVRRNVAQNSNTNKSLIEKLALDSEADVRVGVADNVLVSPEVLSTLSKDADSYVRQAVAGNEATPRATLTELSQDNNYAVRRNVAWNKGTTAASVISLLSDEDETNRRIAHDVSASPEFFAKIVNELEPSGITKEQAENLPTDVLFALLD
jgi:hypothetical protein